MSGGRGLFEDILRGFLTGPFNLTIKQHIHTLNRKKNHHPRARTHSYSSISDYIFCIQTLPVRKITFEEHSQGFSFIPLPIQKCGSKKATFFLPLLPCYNNVPIPFFDLLTNCRFFSRLPLRALRLRLVMLYHSHRLSSSPVPIARCHRYLSRPYLYPLFFLFVLFLLIRWNAVPDPGTTGARFSSDDGMAFEDEIGDETMEGGQKLDSNNNINDDIIDAEEEEEAQMVKVTEEGQKRVIQKPPFLEETEFGQKTTLLKKKKGNTVFLTVYMEAQCPDTTGFIRRQLLPAWARLGTTNRINVTIVPFGKARCARTEAEEGEDYRCECQHGQNECELNQLMNCAIEVLPDADTFVPLIGCVQGKDSVSAAFKSCLAGHSSSDRLWQCAMGRRGRNLHAQAGNMTAAIGDAFNFVPWVVLDGRRDNDAFYALEENICKRLNEPKPIQCIRFS